MRFQSERVPKEPPRVLVEQVSADERRRALEAMAFETSQPPTWLNPMILGSLGLAVVEPAGERFVGEAEALATIAAEHTEQRVFETQILLQAAVAVWANAREGSPASRTAVLRAAVSFVLHHVASCAALAARAADAADDE